MSFHFPGQRENEETLILIRKHWVVYFKIVLAFIVIIPIPLLIFLLIWFNQYPFPQHVAGGLMVGIFSSFYVLYGLVLASIGWINEEFDIFIITNQRLIDITQVSLLQRTVATTPLGQIQDTTANVEGFLPTILNYGNLIIRTAAGNASEFFIDRIPNASDVARSILDYAHQKQEGKVVHPGSPSESVPAT